MLRAPAIWSLVLFLSLASARAAEPQRNTGPWDVERILATPTPVEVDASEKRDDDQRGDNVTAIRYPSEVYRGKPTTVFAYLGVPRTKAAGPFPAMLLVHGGGGKAFAEWARLWADRGYVALAMDLAGNGPDGQRLADGGPPQDDGAKFFALQDEPLKDTWPYQAVAAVLRGHALLAADKSVDPERIGITGISWGGYLTCIVAGIDPKLKVAVPVYGCGFLGDNSAWKESGVFEKLSPAARETWLAKFDPSAYLPGVSCPTLFVNGTNDFAYPLDSYQTSYELVHAPRTLCVTVNMPHSHPAGWAPPEIGAFVDSVLTDGQPLATLSPAKVEDDSIIATYKAAVPLEKAELHYTLDTSRWQDRQWKTVPAEIDAEKRVVSAALPKKRPLAAFLTTRDQRGLVVSTDHVVLEDESMPR